MRRRELLEKAGGYCVSGMLAGQAGQAPPPVAPPEGERDWHDVRAWGVEGKGWQDTDAFYDRFPARAEKIVRPAVWNLSRDTAGMCVRFKTDAPEIAAKWTLRSSQLAMPHMAATGVSGLDLYADDARGRTQWVGVGIPKAAPDAEATLSPV
jgi:hypothetical protein